MIGKAKVMFTSLLEGLGDGEVPISRGIASQLLLLQGNMLVAASAQVQSVCGVTAAWLLLLQDNCNLFPVYLTGAVAAQFVNASGGTASQLLLLQRNVAVTASAQAQCVCGTQAAWLLLLRSNCSLF